jgi:hypothetical protein
VTKLKIVLVVLGVTVPLAPTMGAYDLQNGGLEDPYVGSAPNQVASSWTYYQYGGGLTAVSQAKETTIIRTGTTGLASQKLAATAGTGSANAYFGIRQTIDASPGDAFMFGGWVNPFSAGTGQETSIRVAWDGATTPPAGYLMNWLPLGAQRQLWHQMATAGGSTLAGGNATGTSVTVFLHTARVTSVNLLTYWDDVLGYHAYVPPAPASSNVTETSFDLNVEPGGNSGNSFAQYAITIGGGDYTLGTNWLQSDGTVGTTPVWRTDALWQTKTIAGLLAGTAYTVQIKARYSSTVNQETWLGTGAEIVTLPEPSVVALLGFGLLVVIRRR